MNLLRRLLGGVGAPSLAVGPPSPRSFVLLGWLGLAALLFTYVVRFGVNAPFQDEWYFTPVAVGDSPVWPWLWERHNEHLYPAGRLAYWAATRAIGDFRAATYVSVTLMAAASLALTLAAGQARGRFRACDVFVPALLLNWGHFENVQFGYQIVLILPLTAQAGILLLMLRLPDIPLRRVAVAVGGLLFVLMQGGGFGLAAVPALAGWLAVAGLVLRGRGERGWLVPAVAAVVAVVVTAGVMLTAEKNTTVTPAAGLAGKFTVGLHYLGLAFGPDLATRGGPLPYAGLTALAAHLAALGCLAAAARQPGEFPRAAGLAALVLANLSLAAGLALTRDIGYAPRYATPAAFGLVAAGFAFLLYGPPVPRWGSVAAAGVAVALTVAAVPLARYAGGLQRHHTRMLFADARAGMPPTYLGSKHADHQFFRPDLFATYVGPLARHGVGPFADVPDDPPFRERAVTGTWAFPAWSGPVPPVHTIWAGPPAKLVGVRVRYAVPGPEPYFQLTLRWGNGKIATVYRRPTGGDGEALFWVNDTADVLRLELSSPGGGATITGVWLQESP